LRTKLFIRLSAVKMNSRIRWIPNDSSLQIYPKIFYTVPLYQTLTRACSSKNSKNLANTIRNPPSGIYVTYSHCFHFHCRVRKSFFLSKSSTFQCSRLVVLHTQKYCRTKIPPKIRNLSKNQKYPSLGIYLLPKVKHRTQEASSS